MCDILYITVPISSTITAVDLQAFSGFILLDNLNATGQVEPSSLNILNRSFDRKGVIKYHFPPKINIRKSVNKVCQIYINNKLLSSGSGNSKAIAKIIAAEQGLKILRQICFTVRKKYVVSSNYNILDCVDGSVRDSGPEGGDVSKDVVERAEPSEQHQGVLESPVRSFMNVVGVKGINHTEWRLIEEKFSRILDNYISSNTSHDLVLKYDLSSNERKVLNTIGQRFHLKTKKCWGRQ
uniref:DRBM domain-containing protein n=1 Tax=Graphocephala atropunctata TaxID=36148 RepID=A0A1B6MFK5_9HEMI